MRILYRTVNGVMAWHRCTLHTHTANGVNGMERNGTEQNRMERDGIEWNGMEWNGTKRNERPERDVACPMLHSRVSQILHAILQLNALVHEYIRTSFCFFVFFLKFKSLTLTIAICDYYFMLYYARLDEFIIHKGYTKAINLRKRMYNYFFDVLHFILYILINVNIYVRRKSQCEKWIFLVSI